MIKRSLRLYTGAVLLMIVSVSLTISTLHSHHHLQWNHPEEMADTGSCLTEDTTICPICGYLFDHALPADQSTGSVFFNPDTFTPETSPSPADLFSPAAKGRSPPLPN